VTAIKINLIAPNSLPIVGVKLVDGSTSELECFYDSKTGLQDWKIPNNMLNDNGHFIFVGSDGNEWTRLPSDVLFDSLPHNS